MLMNEATFISFRIQFTFSPHKFAWELELGVAEKKHFGKKNRFYKSFLLA